MSEHTPTPWRIENNRIVGAEAIHTNGRERDASGRSSASYSDTVCECDHWMELPGPKANFELIVRAVNSFTGLLNAAEDLHKKLISVGSHNEYIDCCRLSREIANAKEQS